MSTITLNGAKGGGDFLRLRFWGTVLLMLGALLALGARSATAAPLAGTAIGNQASASYKDNNNIDRLTVSNAVSTVVSQVYSATLDQTQSKIGAPGQTLAFPHTITNTGNGPDTFTLAIAGVTGSAFATTPTTGNAYFADTNCDGIADNNTNITSVGPIAAGSQACFVAQVAMGTTVATSSIAVQAVGSNSVAASNSPNTDTVSVSTNAVMSLTKAISVSAGPTGTRVTYTLTYRNTGNVSAGSVVMADLIPAGATYVPNSATWSSLTSAPLSDPNGDGTQGASGFRIYYATSGAGVVASFVAVLERVDPGVQGTLSFMADITGSGPIINNNGYFCYRDQGTQGTIQPTAANSTVGINTACSNVITSAGNFTGTPTFSFTDINNLAVTANPQKSNLVPFTVISNNTGAAIFNDGRTSGGGGDGLTAAGLPTDGTFSNSGLTSGAGSSGTIAVANFDVVPATAGQGTMATWDAYVWNTGGATDTYNISVRDNNFPSGTTFLLFRADRATPLTDSNSDGTIDTGPVPGYGVSCNAASTGSPNANGASATPCGFRVHVVAQLPPSGVGGPYDLVLRATSGNTPTSFNQVITRLQAVTRSKVDLYNIGGAGQSVYGGATPAASNTVSVAPGGAATYGLVINNPGTVADSYDLAYTVATSAAAVTGAFSATSPYAFTTVCQFGSNCAGGVGDLRGFTLIFYADGGAGNCSTLGPTLTNSGVLSPGASKTVCAIVTVPTVTTAASTGNAASVTADARFKIYFRALSPTTFDGTMQAADTTANGSGSADIKRDDLLLATTRAVTITPNNSGQAIAGGSIQYCHTVTNAGNVNETLSTAQPSQSLATSGWPVYATFYVDTNNNCILDGTEGTAPLANPTASLGTAFTPGLTRNLIVVVQVPNAAGAGQANVTTVQVTGGPATVSAIDTTVVVIGQVQLVKEQAVDHDCNGTSSIAAGDVTNTAGFTQAQIAASPSTAPGMCILYRVTATNIGTQAVSNVIVTDSTPANTKQGVNTCDVGAGTALRATTTGTGTPTPTGPGALLSGSIATGAVPLNPGQNVILTFCVRIDP